jgi:hypothetical protein
VASPIRRSAPAAAQALSDAHAALAGVASRRLLGTLARRLRTGRMSSHVLLDTHRRIGAVPYPAAYGTWWHGLDGRPAVVVGALS